MGSGRKLKLTDETAEKIVKAVRSGAYLKTAARFAGVSASVLRLWMQKGREKPSSVFGKFRQRVTEAETNAEIAAGSVAFRGALSDPDYALRFLSVRWRKRWNPKQQLELSGSKKNPLRLSVGPDLSQLTDEELEALERIAGRVAGPAKTSR
jgi:hypothetical protein